MDSPISLGIGYSSVAIWGVRRAKGADIRAVVAGGERGTKSADFFRVFVFLGLGGEVVGTSEIKGVGGYLLSSEHLN